MPTPIEEFSQALNEYSPEFTVKLRNEDIERLKDYYALLSKWNARLHLVAPCSPREFAIRHVLESLLLLKHLLRGARMVDVGSGAGLPSIPCLLVRNDLRATLIESSPKKSVFLKEALREVKPADRVRVINSRFEETPSPDADYVTCRALDRFSRLLPALIDWAPSRCTFLVFAGESLRKQIESMIPAVQIERIPGSERRYLIVARRLGA